ncbi:ferrous iron transport protein B [Saccharicrinis sp. FJH62]|uniref:ferrous iron transport protein B n=1 Tax=Saccharicrinis sp. FJH62 TaxID=3344657 RepID=UPI0035D526C9
MNLSELRNNEEAVIVKVRGHGAFRRRIIEMGFIRGKVVKVIKNAPLKDPIEYQIMDYQVSLRRSEAANIEVVSVSEGKNLLQNGYEGVYEETQLRNLALEKRKHINIAFVGNPNSGKTTLYNKITGSYEHVGNFSGVTVDAKLGVRKYKGYEFNLVDLPGTYSMTTYSPEERYVRKHILEQKPDIVINVIDASNLERNLYLTTQLIDMDIRVIGVLNMFDEMGSKGIDFNYKALGEMVGIPFVPTVASKGRGITELMDEVIDVYEEVDPVVRHVHINYGDNAESAIRKIRRELSQNKEITNRLSPRFLALKLLERDGDAESFIKQFPEYVAIKNVTKKEIRQLESIYNNDSETIITEAKYAFIAGAIRETVKVDPEMETLNTSRVIDTILTHKLFGFPIFFLFLYIMFKATFSLGQYPMNWLDSGVVWLQGTLDQLVSDGPLHDLLINGILGGVGAVLVFLPNILILYFFISFMEDSGYMARAAFIMDRLMHKIGLHGKSFIPLIMGFGCNVPAIMATRTIEDNKNRLLTILLIPLMSCSARLPVYILIIGSFFPEHASLLLLSIYVLGILLAIIFARVFKKTIIKKSSAPFVMELPPYRLPSIRTTGIHMWKRGEQYVKKIAGVVLLASIAIWMLGYFPHNHEMINTYETQIAKISQSTLPQSIQQDSIKAVHLKMNADLQAHSYLGQVGRFIEPALRPLGFNWKVGVSLLCGIPAKEIIVSTISVLYQQEDIETGKLSEKLRNPITINGETSPGLNKTSALALVVFVLIYFPCLATLSSIKVETGSWKWAMFTLGYTSVLAYFLAFVVNSAGNLLF